MVKPKKSTIMNTLQKINERFKKYEKETLGLRRVIFETISEIIDDFPSATCDFLDTEEIGDVEPVFINYYSGKTCVVEFSAVSRIYKIDNTIYLKVNGDDKLDMRNVTNIFELKEILNVLAYYAEKNK